jgi:hypothetical protein
MTRESVSATVFAIKDADEKTAFLNTQTMENSLCTHWQTINSAHPHVLRGECDSVTYVYNRATMVELAQIATSLVESIEIVRDEIVIKRKQSVVVPQVDTIAIC